MPADSPHPATDLPSTAVFDLSAEDHEKLLMGYECALPWLQVAPQGIDPTRPLSPGNPPG